MSSFKKKKSINWIRKIAAVMMVIVLCFSLAGCGKNADKTAKSIRLETLKKVTVWYTNDKYTPYLEYVAEQVNQANDLIEIKPQLMDSENYLENIYNSSIHGSDAPDVYIMSADQLEKANMMGLVLKNNTYAAYYNEKNFSKAAIEAATFDNELYGYPLSFNIPFMVYNKDVAQKVSTFDELYQYALNYKIDDKNVNIKQIFDWDVSNMFINYCFSCGSIDIGGETGDDISSLNVNKEILKKAMEQYVKQKEQFGIVRGTNVIDDTSTKFAEGTMAYTITDVNHLKEIDSSSVPYEIIKVPKLAQDLDTSLMSENMDVFVSPYADDIEVAKAVAHCLSYDYADTMFDKAGLLCAKNSASKDKNAKDSNNKDIVYQLFNDSRCQAQFMGQTYYYSRYEIMIHKVWDGEDITTAVDTFAADFIPQK